MNLAGALYTRSWTPLESCFDKDATVFLSNEGPIASSGGLNAPRRIPATSSLRNWGRRADTKHEMQADDDVAIIRALVERLLKALDGPDPEALAGCIEDDAMVFFSPPPDLDGQTVSWRVLTQRLRTVLVRARQGPARPRVRAERPRFTIEVGEHTAGVLWHASGTKIRRRTRALTLVKHDGRWTIRHVQLWSLRLQFKATVNGRERWFNLLPLLAVEQLPPDFLGEAKNCQKVWFATCGFMAPARLSLR